MSLQSNPRFQIKLSFLISLSLFPLNSALGAMPESEYLAALKFASDKVAQKKALQANANSLSSSVIKSLYGRYYQVGDSWDVAAWQTRHSTMRMTSDPRDLQNTVGNGGVFHYEVLNVKTGLNPEVTIQVTQTESNGLSIIDPQVTRLTLLMNDQLVQSEKTYYFKNDPKGKRVSIEGARSNLEQYPLDVPEVSTAEKKANPSLPELPQLILNFATQVGFKPNLNQSFWFEQDDFYGRPVQVLWQKGDPWPAYLKTTAGIAILIRKGAQ